MPWLTQRGKVRRKTQIRHYYAALENPPLETVAYLGEATGPYFLGRMRDKMLVHPTGRRILREKPIINSQTMDLERLRGLPDGTFGREYVRFLDDEGVSPDTRVPVRPLSTPQKAHVSILIRAQGQVYWER